MTRKSLAFHIKSNDLFGTFATIIDLVRQDAVRGYGPRHDQGLRRLRKDFMFLQRHCRLLNRTIDAGLRASLEQTTSGHEDQAAHHSRERLGPASHSSRYSKRVIPRKP